MSAIADLVFHRICPVCGSVRLSAGGWVALEPGFEECRISCVCGENWEEVRAEGQPVPGMEPDPGVPEDIPIREKDTGNVFYIRVENGAVKLYDVDDKQVKSWYEFWK